MQRREQLTNINNLNVNDIHFGQRQTFKIPDSPLTYDRVPITINHDENTFGSLLLKTEKCFSFGAQQNINKETGQVYGWTLPISMFDREETTPDQVLFVRRFNYIVNHCKDHIKEEYCLNDESLDKLGGCLWYPDDGSRGPILYAKIVSGRNGNTRYDSRFARVKDLLKKTKGKQVAKEEITENCNVIAVIRVDSIYVCEEKAHLQVKVYEANIEKLGELPTYL